ncbi:MAG: DUF4832 domain-containing protein [candidate division KSB1 bacterium]|nr:DUF4832 domain-containing protein [candidate division KSB1 bacterium]
MVKLNSILLILLIPVFSLLNYCSKKSTNEPDNGSFQLEEIDDVIPNPFKGFAPWIGDENPIYETKLQYATFAWSELEPRKGVYNWARLEKDWGNVAQTGKRVGFRIAAAIPGSGQIHTPQWLIDQGVRMRPYSIDGHEGLAPDWDDPKFLAAHHDFIMALGARYDRDPRVAWIDIGSYGFWGEWHVWLNDSLAATQATKQKILEDYFAAFPTKPKVIAFDDDFATKYVTDRGCGIRNDCLGTKESNDWYLESLNQIDPLLNDRVWKTAIITGEFCGSNHGAIEGTTERFDLNFEFIKKTHWSFIGPAGGTIEPQSESHRRDLDKLHKMLGYRFVLRDVVFEKNINRGDTLKLTIRVENKGVAPFYLPWPVVIYFVDSDGTAKLEHVTGVNITQWLPGLHTEQIEIFIPESVPLGTYDLKIAIPDPDFKIVGILFANKGKDELGRFLLGRLQIS